MSNHEAPRTVAIPANPLCHADAPIVTLNSAHAMMELIVALNCDDGASQFEMPESINVTLAHMRELVRDSIKYAEEVLYHDACMTSVAARGEVSAT